MKNQAKAFILRLLKKRGIHLSRFYHPNDFTLSRRILIKLMKDSVGVLHIGAHLGQEAQFYDDCGKSVIWIEANPQIIERLQFNLRSFPNQRVICALLGRNEGNSINFNVSSNDAASSSIFKFSNSNPHKIEMVKTINLPMRRLDHLIQPEDLKDHRFWVIDVQGAELEVLMGAGRLLSIATTIYVEVKRITDYLGGVRWDELEKFLDRQGFIALWEPEEDSEDNIIFVRRDSKARES